MIIIITILSFLLEFTLNKTLFNTILVPLTVLTTLIITETYFKKQKKYYVYAFITGFIYDTLYTNTVLINAVLFMNLAVFTKYINKNITNNPLRLLINIILSIMIYQLMTYFIHLIIDVEKLNIKDLLEGLYKPLILNILYGYAIYYLIIFLNKKHKKNKKDIYFFRWKHE